MIEWVPVAVNEKPALRGKILLPEYSAAVVGSSVVLRWFGGGLTRMSMALTTIGFSSAIEAEAWIATHRMEFSSAIQADSDQAQNRSASRRGHRHSTRAPRIFERRAMRSTCVKHERHPLIGHSLNVISRAVSNRRKKLSFGC
jgi:hypothetical protein